MSEGKSGLRELKAGEVLFNDGDRANSLFIIQKGQLRLYKPKGKGFIEIAVLRSGEVIGEMAFFDKENGSKRSCAASAMVGSQIIEISFVAFEKTFASLNPWFKTIINTLVTRLRSSNSRIRELETNAGTLNYGNNKGYEFLKSIDCLKILGTLFLIYKSHGEAKSDSSVSLHRKTIDLYVKNVYHLADAKLEEVFLILEDLGYISISDDEDDMPMVFTISSLPTLQDFFIFLNTEKHLPDDKKMNINSKSQTFLEEIYKEIITKDPKSDKMILVPVTNMIKKWKEAKLGIDLHHLDDPRAQKIVGDVFPENGSMIVEVNFSRLQRMLPRIRLLSRIKQSNAEKQQ